MIGTSTPCWRRLAKNSLSKSTASLTFSSAFNRFVDASMQSPKLAFKAYFRWLKCRERVRDTTNRSFPLRLKTTCIR